MAYASGTITSSATPAIDLISLVEAMLTTHAAWTFVEEYTLSTQVSRVWKCDGALNGYGQDFYIILYRLTASDATDVTILAAEQYNSTTHLVIRGCANPGSTATPEPIYNSRYGDTGYAFNYGNWNIYCTVSASSATFDYYIRVTNNSILVVSSASNGYGIGAGLFTPLFPSQPNEFPLAQFHWGNKGSDNSSSVSRRPSITTSITDAFGIYYSYATTNSAYETLIGGIADTSDPMYQSDGPVGARFLIRHTYTTGGSYRGYLSDIMVFSQHTDVSVGDTIQINGELWVCFSDSGSYGLWANTVAA